MLGLGVTVIGFIPTYFKPLVTGDAAFPLLLHLHGLFAASWLIIFALQNYFIKHASYAYHRILGRMGAVIALGVVITLFWVGYYQAGIQYRAGHDNVLVMLGNTLDGLTFGLLVLLAVKHRHDKQTHQRLMLLATILVLWVAWVRLRHYFPPFEGAFNLFGFWLAMLPIPIFCWLEFQRTGKIHPAMLYGGVGVIAEQGMQILLDNSKAWRELALLYYETISRL